MMVRICDVCGEVIEKNQPYTTMSLYNSPHGVNGKIFEIDGADCISQLLDSSYGEQPEEEVEEEVEEPAPTLEESKEAHPSRLKLKKTEPKEDLDMDDRIANEKRYRKEADKISSAITGVRSGLRS